MPRDPVKRFVTRRESIPGASTAASMRPYGHGTLHRFTRLLPGWPGSSTFRSFRETLRRLFGADDYERYLAHHRAHHAGDGPPLDRRAFYDAELERKWSGVRRCC